MYSLSGFTQNLQVSLYWLTHAHICSYALQVNGIPEERKLTEAMNL